MVNASIVFKYFPNLTEIQKDQFNQLYPLYVEWNAKINVISRKDIEELYVHHVLHALSIARLINFKNVHSVLDIGTGGGFPGIPLAILFPQIDFHLVDSIGKKITVVQAVANGIGLSNVKAEQARAEQINGKYDIIMCRAVTQLTEFYGWISKNLKPDSEVVCLKGGDLNEEIHTFKQAYRNKKVKEFFLFSLFEDAFFETKKLILVR